MKIRFCLNEKQCLVDARENETLLELLRNRMHITSVKRGCESGECGACTVIVDGEAVASCMFLAAEAKGKSVITIEGVAKDGRLDAIQTAFIEKGAVQCGFCTSGMILSAKALLDQNPQPSREEIKEAIAGNICRCTGYEQIIEAITYAARLRRQI